MTEETEPRHTTLDEALYAIRQEVGPLIRDAEADTGKYTYRYVTLPTVVEKVDPIAKAHGVVLRHQLNLDVMRHELWFNNVVVEAYDILLPNPQGTAQGLGSAISYMRRYDAVTTFGLVAPDDDGAAASAPAPAATIHREAPERPVAPLKERAEAVAAKHAPTPTREGTIDADF